MCTLTDLPEVQMSPFLSALRCFFLICQHYAIPVVPERFMGLKDDEPAESVLRLMDDVGLRGRLLKNRTWKQLAGQATYPVMAEQEGGFWVIVASTVPTSDGKDSVAVMDPRSEQSGLTLMPRAAFEKAWTGTLLMNKEGLDTEDNTRPFGLRWFMPDIMKQRKFFRDIVIAMLMSNIISFAMPLAFQIMLDKVLPHHSYQTLFTLTVILIVAMLFDLLFGYVRQILTLHATNKIDARLITRSFEHLLRLPMPFFEGMPTGILIQHMRQAEAIRGFLTGQLFMTVLSLTALPLLLVGLTLYSGKLTLLVLSFTLAMLLVIIIMLPIIRKQLEKLYQAEGARSADLVECIHGMRQVKSMALEPLRSATWSEKVHNSILQRTNMGRLGAVAGSITGMLEGLMGLSVLTVGVLEVFDGNLTIGALVAFNMLSGRVTGPLTGIVSLIQSYQQTALAVKMLGGVMDHPPERDPNQHGATVPVTGQLEFQNVTFIYDKAASAALSQVSFKIEEGQMIGVVGRSGSGKTTITRLIQSIHTPQEGSILFNGNDIRQLDLPHLRHNVGVVLQENILFRGTIRENIAAAKPDASLAEVIDMAKLAGADEFIDRLPRSYETFVDEGGSNFSGGQRQRIAIARVLMLAPPILIFDEATSALDPDSETIIRDNLGQISQGRTMIIVSHRLSSLVSTDAILVLDQGRVLDYAPHATLLERCDIYRHLWEQQHDY